MKKLFRDCQVERRVLRAYGHVNPDTGEANVEARQWTFEACGNPLLEAEEKKSGVCTSCRRGWTAKHNYPTGNGLALIEKVRGTRVLQPWEPGTLIVLQEEEHRVQRYTNQGSYVVLLRALGWEVKFATESVAKRLGNTAVIRFMEDSA